MKKRWLTLGARFLILSGLIAGWAAAEQIEFSTYYPTSPGGAGGGNLRGDDAAIGANFKALAPPANGLIVEGRVGIGTSTPVAALNIQAGGSPAAPAFVFGDDADTGIYYGGEDTIAIAGGGRRLLWLDGGIMPETMFFIRGSHDFQIADDQNNAVRFAIRGSTGNVGIATSNPTQTLHVVGNACKTAGGTAWVTCSDLRLKKNVGPIEGALDKVLRLRGVTFKWKAPASTEGSGGLHMGMIGQEVERVLPQWVTTDPEGFKYLGPEGFEALTVEAIREQQKMIELLKSENAALSKRLEALEQRERSQ